ncbi:MAG: CCA tRNA nucleotidyltransferase [Candidatus Yanofskybacteria bacterium]|nr:CCA tRNA nucleotidyltransferase [Candidatus Yanofskybacteria bacterium]
MLEIHPKVGEVLRTLEENGHRAYAVGGCVRDIMMERHPTDWDVTTDARPERIQELFPDNFYDNAFGTVTVKTRDDDPIVRTIQITPFRIEGRYTDQRHPDEVTFAKTIEEDLSRRDFTVNAMAMSADGTLVDPYGGRDDLSAKIIRAVGDADTRITEDALRMMRAVRFATTLDFSIHDDTLRALTRHAALLERISAERIRDELTKILNAPRAMHGIQLLEDTGLLRFILPELREGVGVEQNLHHIYTVWEHNLRTMHYAAQKGYSFPVRMACLLHDVGKPRTKRGEGRHCTFYAHDAVGATMARKIMERLKYPGETVDAVVRLVRYHMFYYSVGEVTESSVRRLIANVGLEHIDDLLRLREGDRIGSGTPKAVPYKLRHLKYMIDKVSHDPISVKMLKVNGQDIMEVLGIPPGPKIGLILNTLLAEALDDPTINTRELLLKRAGELDAASAADLKSALERIEQARDSEEKERMKKYYV